MNLNLQLNPISLLNGFESQAYNIQQTYRKPLRKNACLLEAIAAHIRKVGHDCFASSERLVDFYNSAAPRYGVAPISRRTLFNLLDRLEAEGFISRALTHVKGTWVTQRHLLINYDAVGRVFEAVLNWAIKAADAAVERKRDKKLHSGGGDEENPSKASSDKALATSAETESCTLNTNRSFKENKNKGEPPTNFFEKYFKEKAAEVQALQQAARLGKITANDAKKLIKIHNQYGYPLAEKFKKFLNYVIMKGNKKKSPPDPTQMAPKPQKTETKKPPIDGKEFGSTHCRDAAYLAPPDDHHVKLGLAEYYRDEIGRVHVRWLDNNKIEQAAAIGDESLQTKNESTLIDNYFLQKHLQKIRKLIS
ncbi:MAG: hypothetical protein ACRCWB_05165 [Enterovibrio sp.]